MKLFWRSSPAVAGIVHNRGYVNPSLSASEGKTLRWRSGSDKTFLAAAIVIFSFLLAVSGCGRTGQTTSKDQKPANGEAPQQTSLEVVIEMAHGTMDLVKCQKAIELMNNHVSSQSSAREELAKDKVDKDVLGQEFSLTEGEITYVSGSTFSSMDAYHLEWCFRLHDAADALRLEKLPPLKRAEEAFAWAMRQVALEQVDEMLLPPQSVLLRGRGTAEERALVFLDFLQQVDLQGCMIAYPAKNGGKKQYWLAGVLIDEGKEQNIYLFDPRLGLPLPGPEGKGIATLAQVRKQPERIKALSVGKDYEYDVTPEQAAKAEVHLAYPISALSARMRYLEKQLNKHIKINLAVQPAEALKTFAKAAGGKVYVWNEKGVENQPLPATAVRALPRFLPNSQGGVGSEEAYRSFQNQLFPISSLRFRFRVLKVYEELPPLAREQMIKLTKELFLNYIFFPQDKLTRGRLEDMLGPLHRINTVLKEVERGPSKDAEDIQKKIADWRQRVEKVYAAGDSPEGKAALSALWSEDLYLLMLVSPGKEEEEISKEIPKRILSYIVLYSASESLNEDLHYLLSQYWLEKAERAQIEIDKVLAEKKKPSASQIQQAGVAWKNVRDWTAKFVDRYGIKPGPDLTAYLHEMQQAWDLGDPVEMGPWQQLIKDVHRSLALRLQQVDALIASGQADQARTSAQALADDVQALMKSTEIKELASNYKNNIKTKIFDADNRDLYLKVLQRFLDTLEPGGSVQWYGHAAALRAKLVKK